MTSQGVFLLKVWHHPFVFVLRVSNKRYLLLILVVGVASLKELCEHHVIMSPCAVTQKNDAGPPTREVKHEYSALNSQLRFILHTRFRIDFLLFCNGLRRIGNSEC
jgi:hypothetical protein